MEPITMMAIGTGMGLAGGGMSYLGSQRAAREKRQLEAKREAAYKENYRQFKLAQAPIKSAYERQAIEGPTAQEKSMMDKYRDALRGTASRSSALGRRQRERALSPYGEQGSTRAIQMGEQYEDKVRQQQFEADTAYGMKLQNLGSQRRQQALSRLAGMAGSNLSAANMVAGNMPMSTSGKGEAMGQLGSTVMGIGGKVFAHGLGGYTPGGGGGVGGFDSSGAMVGKSLGGGHTDFSTMAPESSFYVPSPTAVAPEMSGSVGGAGVQDDFNFSVDSNWLKD